MVTLQATMRTLIPLVCTAWLIALCPSWAGENGERFLELHNDEDTTTFDLSTVQIIQPGRFSINSTTIDDPFWMTFELKMLATLRPYCLRPAGKYSAPASLLTLGPPDMPVKSIDVISKARKVVSWDYPYKRLGNRNFVLSCNKQDQFEQELMITNGISSKYLFDCKRGLVGFFDGIGDPSKVPTFVVPANLFVEHHYMRVCYTVMHEWPFMPERPASAQVDLGITFELEFHDYAEAAKWFRLAASQGDAQGQIYLASMFELGNGVKQDYSEAAKWYRLAAEQGDGDGQQSIGISYYTGQGVPQDYVQAYKWFTLALAHFPVSDNSLTNMAHNNCIEWREKVAAQMTSIQLAEAQRQVSTWRPNSLGK